MTSELSPRRRFLLFGVLPLSLLMIGGPLTFCFGSQMKESLQEMRTRVATIASTKAPASLSPVQVTQRDTDYGAPRISPTILKGLQQSRRMVALDVISRLEEEAHQQGGNIHLTPLDLKRLRNALRETGSVPISSTD